MDANGLEREVSHGQPAVAGAPAEAPLSSVKTWLSLAVIRFPPRTPADSSELERGPTDDPHAVLKTAGLTSAHIHRRPVTIDSRAGQSRLVCPRPR
jgi:hypothetical protein